MSLHNKYTMSGNDVGSFYYNMVTFINDVTYFRRTLTPSPSSYIVTELLTLSQNDINK